MNSPARTPRFRYSLRMLLGLMGVIAFSLAVFRWPWVEVARRGVVVDAESGRLNQDRNEVACEVRTTYRRDWRGRAIRHGTQQTWQNGQLWHEANFYEGKLNGPRRVFNMAGQLMIEAHYRNGQWHGPFRAGDGVRWYWVGNYQNAERQGTWRDAAPGIFEFLGTLPPDIDAIFSLDGTPISERDDIEDLSNSPYVQSEWDDGKRKGTTCRFAADGELLSSAYYERDLLVSWNGAPVVDQFRQWLLSTEVNDPALCDLLFTNCAVEGLRLGRKQVGVSVSRPGRPPETLVISTANELKSVSLLTKDHRDQTPLGATLCEFALISGYRFQYRYGGLCLVNAVDPEPPFVDPTGVNQIRFEPGSSQALEWEEMIDIQQGFAKDGSWGGEMLSKTSIPFDLRTELNYFYPFAQVPHRRKRRDALGFYLYCSDCCCELVDGRLVIQMRPRRE